MGSPDTCCSTMASRILRKSRRMIGSRLCWGKHVCHMGVVKALKALSAMPQERRTTGQAGDTITEGNRVPVIHHIYKTQP